MNWSKWWIYQRERFPLLNHGLLIFAFSCSAVCFSALLRGEHEFPRFQVITVAFLSSFFSFLHLRIADEFKDFEEDSRFRPYRPVPRGLVSLRELAFLWGGTALIQIGLAFWLDFQLIYILSGIWLYLLFMCKEFFVRNWIKARPFTYMWTHMLIIPLVDFYATACDWGPNGWIIPSGLFWFVAVSFFNGFVIEIGRKIRTSEEEEKGVETYTALWGKKKAIGAWMSALIFTGVSTVVASILIDFAIPVGVAVFLILGINVFYSFQFLNASFSGTGKIFEILSGIWTLVIYLFLGIVPMLIHFFEF